MLFLTPRFLSNTEMKLFSFLFFSVTLSTHRCLNRPHLVF